MRVIDWNETHSYSESKGRTRHIYISSPDISRRHEQLSVVFFYVREVLTLVEQQINCVIDPFLFWEDVKDAEEVWFVREDGGRGDPRIA